MFRDNLFRLYTLASNRLLTCFFGRQCVYRWIIKLYDVRCAGGYVKWRHSESVFAMFQLTFAIITPALIVGGFAERMKFSSMLLFTGFWLLLVYAPVTHWVWGGGWLGELGLLDFAGGTVVHVTAGVAALTAALVMGSRKGFPQTPMPPHNMTMTVTGAGMLWVGWFGFNGGSALAAMGTPAWLSSSHTFPLLLLPSLGCVWNGSSLVSPAPRRSYWNGSWPGTITPASGFVGPGGALIIGIAAGVICFNATIFLKQNWELMTHLMYFQSRSRWCPRNRISCGFCQ